MTSLLIIKSFETIPVSRVFAFPVNICRKSWYSCVSEMLSLVDEYMFIVMKNDIISSNGPRHRPLLEDPQIYPKYSGEEPFVQSLSGTLSATISGISVRNSWNADFLVKKNKNIILR